MHVRQSAPICHHAREMGHRVKKTALSSLSPLYWHSVLTSRKYQPVYIEDLGSYYYVQPLKIILRTRGRQPPPLKEPFGRLSLRKKHTGRHWKTGIFFFRQKAMEAEGSED